MRGASPVSEFDACRFLKPAGAPRRFEIMFLACAGCLCRLFNDFSNNLWLFGRKVCYGLRNADAKLLLDLLFDLIGNLWVSDQVVARVLFALAQLLALVGIPSTRLLDDVLVDTKVKQRTFT